MKVNKEPPVTRFRYADWSDVVDAGHANPGEWVSPDREYPHSVVTALSRGKNSLFPPDDWEFRTSNTRYDIADGKRFCTIHFKYKGSTT